MQTAIDLKHLPETEVLSGDVLGSELANLPHGNDVDLRYGRLRLSGTGTTVMPCSMLTIIRSGTLTAMLRDGPLRFSAGDVVTVGRGGAIYWEAEDARLSMVCHFGVEMDEYCGKIDLAHPLVPSMPPAEALLLSSVPDCSRVCFREPSEFSYGIWLATPYHRIPNPMPSTELMHILEGSVTSYTEDGRSQVFEKGDTFIAPQGAALGWKSEVVVRKLWMLSHYQKALA